MATFLLTWNPKKWPWTDLRSAADAVAERGEHVERWSCGRTRKIENGDRVFLLQQGQEPRGILASGIVVSAPYEADHWDPARSQPALYVDVRFDALQDPETDPILPRQRLDAPEFSDVYWNTQASGIRIPPHVADVLEVAWSEVIGADPSSGRTGEPVGRYEGTPRAVTLTVYERNREARSLCLAHYGAACVVCGMDFGARYGDNARGYIHVHHLTPLAEISSRYEVDPVEDLRPVCPNCHAVIHLQSPPRTIDEVRRMIGSER